MWSSKLSQSLKALGHHSSIAEALPESSEPGDVAIINLSDKSSVDLIPGLHALGIKVLGHAGHKEKELHELGTQAGVDLMATNSELTFKLDELLGRL